MRRIDRVVESAIDRTEVLRAARAWRVLKHWPKLVGSTLATVSAPDRYERGTVFVAVTGSAWAMELRMKKDSILQRLKEAGGEPGLFEALRFGVRSLPIMQKEEEGPSVPAAPRAVGSIQEIGTRMLQRRKDAGGD